MPNQDEGEYRPVGSSQVQVRVALCPRSQPFDESVDSLNVAIGVAQMAGFRIVIEKVRKGCPGFQNAGPVLAHFLKSKDTHLFLGADDVVYPPDTLVRLINADRDIVSGIYRKNRLDRIEPANLVESGEKFLACLHEGGIYETEFAAGHTMTIKRAVIEKMVADYPELEYDDKNGSGEVHYGLFLPIIESRQCYQDDWSFSIRARKSGFRIWNDFGVKLKHFCGDFLGFEALEKIEVTNAGS